jgi:hypothetical protein
MLMYNNLVAIDDRIYTKYMPLIEGLKLSHKLMSAGHRQYDFLYGLRNEVEEKVLDFRSSMRGVTIDIITQYEMAQTGLRFPEPGFGRQRNQQASDFTINALGLQKFVGESAFLWNIRLGNITMVSYAADTYSIGAKIEMNDELTEEVSEVRRQIDRYAGEAFPWRKRPLLANMIEFTGDKEVGHWLIEEIEEDVPRRASFFDLTARNAGIYVPEQ